MLLVISANAPLSSLSLFFKLLVCVPTVTNLIPWKFRGTILDFTFDEYFFGLKMMDWWNT
jgi:hypothetical protein